MDSKQSRLTAGEFAAEIFVRARGGDAPARGAVDQADLHEVGLVHLFDGVFFFGEHGGEGAEADGAAGILVQQRKHQVAVHFVEALRVHTQHLQCFLRHRARDTARRAHFRKIARAPQQAVGDARRSAAAARDFFGAAFVHLDIQNFRRAVNDDQQIRRLVKIQPVHDAEPRAQRRGNQPRAGRRADQREVPQRKGMNPRARPLSDNQVDAEIFHRGIKHFFDGGLQAVNFVEKENLFLFERSQDRRQVALALQQRPRAGLDRNVQFVGDDLRQRGLAQPGRAVKQHVVQRFAAAARRVDSNLNIFFDALLPDVLVETLGAHAYVNARVFVKRLPGDNPLWLSLLHHPFCRSIRHSSLRFLSARRLLGPGRGVSALSSSACFSAQAPRAARPFGALKDCNVPRSNFSKFPAPASRFASPTAVSAARASYPRFTSAEMTSASIPAGEDAAGFSVSTATASNLSFNSTTMRSAVFRPTPGIRVSRARSLPRIAGTSSSTLIPLKIFSASVGPTPDAESSISKKCFSRAETNPYNASASSRTCVWIRRVTSVCSSPSAPYVESGTCTRYPTPPTSTSTWFGLFSASRPRSWPIIARQYCRFSFARQRRVELQRPYLPMSSACARMCPFMARSTSAFVAPALRFSFTSRAYSLKK